MQALAAFFKRRPGRVLGGSAFEYCEPRSRDQVRGLSEIFRGPATLNARRRVQRRFIRLVYLVMFMLPATRIMCASGTDWQVSDTLLQKRAPAKLFADGPVRGQA